MVLLKMIILFLFMFNMAIAEEYKPAFKPVTEQNTKEFNESVKDDIYTFIFSLGSKSKVVEKDD